MRIEKYFKGDEEGLPEIFEAILQRRLTGKHDETDDELVEELRMKPLDDVKDKEFESDFEELYETDQEIDNLYNARDYVVKKMGKDEYFNMDDKKWDAMISEAVQHGYLKDTRECEDILEDMLSWDKLLPGAFFCNFLIGIIISYYVVLETRCLLYCSFCRPYLEVHSKLDFVLLAVFHGLEL